MNFIRDRILKREFLSGAWVNLASPMTAEMAGIAGYDWLLIDQEHAPGDNLTLLNQIQAVSRFPTAPIVRIAWSDRILIKKSLDLGAAGIMVPYVQNKEEAKEVVTLSKYPPIGDRGVASAARCAEYSSNFANYFQTANDATCIIAQIETDTAVENAESIASVDGIDAIFVGPLDLSINTNLRGMYDDERFIAKLKHVSKAAENAGKGCGILLPHVKWIPLLKELNFTFIACGTDGTYVLNAMKSTLESLRD